MGEKQTGYIGIEENPSTIIIARRPITLIAKKNEGTEGSGRKNFKGWTQRNWCKK
jgi:hypothetical protein